MKKRWQQLIIMGMGVLGVAGAAWGADIKVGGGGASMTGIFLPVKPHYEQATGDMLTVLTSSPKDGLVDLVNGKVDIAVGAVPFDSMVAGAQKAGAKIDVAALVKQEIGTNRTVVLVHPSNKVTKLSREELKGIFTGKITNWKAVGGEDKDIVVVWGIGTPGQNAQFKKEILDGEEVEKDVLETTSYVKIKESVAGTPEGIGIDPFGLVDDTVKVVDAPRLVSPIIAVTIGKPSPDVQKVLDYVKGPGARYVKK